MSSTSGRFGWLAATTLIVVMHAPGLRAQGKSHNKKPAFDVTRMADSVVRPTFHVTKTELLREVLKAGTVNEGTRIVVTETAGGRLALLTDQIAYHHVAQGRVNGKDWMATF